MMKLSTRFFRSFSWLLTLALVLGISACQTPSQPADTTKLHAFNSKQVKALRDMGFVPDGQDWALSFSESKFLFDSGVDTLNQHGLEEMGSLARNLLKINIEKVRVEGHTDNVGNPTSNQGLSLRRAENVARQMVRIGFKPASVSALGYGDSKPIFDNASADGRAQNRRVTLIVMAE
jgi:outer membrane protein OmpA-like peptidoglycan-associated protein